MQVIKGGRGARDGTAGVASCQRVGRRRKEDWERCAATVAETWFEPLRLEHVTQSIHRAHVPCAAHSQQSSHTNHSTQTPHTPKNVRSPLDRITALHTKRPLGHHTLTYLSKHCTHNTTSSSRPGQKQHKMEEDDPQQQQRQENEAAAAAGGNEDEAGPPRPPQGAEDEEEEEEADVGPQPPKPKKRKVCVCCVLCRLPAVRECVCRSNADCPPSRSSSEQQLQETVS